MKTRVVVTGMGAITPIGNDVKSFWSGLKEKKVGIEMCIRDREYRVDQLKFKPRRRKDKGSVADAELKALEALEKREGKSKLDDN